jgi:hypothetical protein
MDQENMFQGEMDPEIAALLGTAAVEEGDSIPNFASIFDDEVDDDEALAVGENDVTEEKFPEITKRFESTPINAFNDPNYYKIALSGEGDVGKRVNTILQKYLNTKDPKDRGVYRQQFITIYWDFLLGVAHKAAGKISDPKKFLLRYGMMHPAFIDADNRGFFSKLIVDNELSQPIYYLDEWFKAVGAGIIKNSATDEVRIAKNNNQMHLQQLLDKAIGKLDSTKLLLRTRDNDRINLEKSLVDRVKLIVEHYPIDGMPEVGSCYNEAQKKIFSDVQELLKNLVKADRDMEGFLRDMKEAEADVNTLREKVREAGGTVAIDVKAVDTEYETVKQMAKLTIGRQGNHFPILMNEYYHCMPSDVAFRENVIEKLSWIESIDSEAFKRPYRKMMNRIVPYIVLVPCYGDYGICWEPFDRHNRATSRGRIAIPMYPKNLTIALLSAMGDLRWQMAKEKASYYWMEEGLTGEYYQWFTKMKLKGDVKETFIQDYILWVTKESDAVQKLDKEVRTMFWIRMPFSQAVKDKLKDRSLAYNNLYRGDATRAARGF